MGVSVAVGTGIAVAAGSTGCGEASRTGAGATVAAVLHADNRKATDRAMAVNFGNFFLVTIIHPLSLMNTFPSENSGGVRILSVCGSAPFGYASRPYTLKMRFFNNFRIRSKIKLLSFIVSYRKFGVNEFSLGS
jgi:hypothetical protein